MNKFFGCLLLCVSAFRIQPAWATNGMNLDGFGAQSGAMGGTAQAYDIGNAAMMKNPATLSLLSTGNHVDVGLAVLLPSVQADTATSAGGATSTSAGKAYYMPSLSWVRRSGRWAYGLGVMPQGGMGTEWSGSSFLSGGSDRPQRSAVSVGRVMLPVVYAATDRFSVAGQLDWVWANLDLQMLHPEMGYVDVSHGGKFTGQLRSSGFAYKLGVLYRALPHLMLGASYHSQTHLGDMTGTGTLNGVPTAYRVRAAQWPAAFGLGLAWQVTSPLLFTADIQRLRWSRTMQNFNFGPDGAIQALPLRWRDQTVYAFGLAYRLAPHFVLRAGYNYGADPVPDATLNYLGPAITERHYSVGLGWAIDPAHHIDVAATFAPRVTRTNPNPAGDGHFPPLTLSQRQYVLRVDYRYQF